MENLENLKSNALNGWLQKCEQCNAVTAYDQYSISCEHCGSSIHTIFFKCPECGVLSNFGTKLCSGCKKKISDLVSQPFMATEVPANGKAKKIRLLKFFTAFLLFSSLVYAVGLNIFIAIVVGVLIGIFCLFL